MRKVLTVEGGDVIGIYENGLRVFSKKPRVNWILSNCPEFGLCYEAMGIKTDELSELFTKDNDKACEFMLLTIQEVIK